MQQLSNKNKRLLFWLEVVATIAGVAGALAIALNLNTSKYGYFIFLISSIASVGIGHLTKLRSMIILSYMYSAINIIGIYRWFF